MARRRKSLERILHSLLTLVASTVITGAVAALLKGVIPWSESLLNILMVAFILVALASLVTTRLGIAEEIDRSRIAVYARYKAGTTEGDAEIYRPIIRRLGDAKKSIRIMGSFRGSGSNSSKSRGAYYREMAEIIREKIERDEHFLYERIVQVDEVRPGGVLYRDQVDSVLFEHCADVLAEIKKDPGPIELHLKQVAQTLPSLTLVIIDDSDIIICFPHIHREGEAFDMQQLGTALFFQDRESTFWKEMGRIFERISLFASPIQRTEDRQMTILGNAAAPNPGHQADG